jgi:hypothetical protein
MKTGHSNELLQQISHLSSMIVLDHFWIYRGPCNADVSPLFQKQDTRAAEDETKWTTQDKMKTSHFIFLRIDKTQYLLQLT